MIRAVAEDPKLAELFGINAKVVYLCVFVFECAAVAFGAALVAPRSPILTSMGFNEVIMTFVVVVLGGIGSIGGALVAGLGLGLFIAFFGAFIAQAYTTAAALGVLLALLVVRPGGVGNEMTAIETSSSNSDAGASQRPSSSRWPWSAFFLPRLTGRNVGRVFDADHDRDLRRHVLRRRYRAVLSRRSQPRPHPVLGRRRLCRRQSLGEIRAERLGHGARDHRALHRRGRIPRRRHPAHPRVRVLAGDLCGGGRGYEIAFNWDAIGGSDGIVGISALKLPFGFATYVAGTQEELWPVAFGLLLLTLVFIARFRRSRLGTTALMVQMNPALATSLGIDPRKVRLAVFVISAPITGLAGWLYAYQRAYVGPDMFETYFLVMMLTAVVLVGRRILLGPLIGTAC